MSRDSPLRAERDEEVLRFGEDRVAIIYDPDGECWRIGASSVPGLAAEAPTRDELVDALPALIRATALP